MSDRHCTHKPSGYVTNQPEGYDPDRAHASRVCCTREACVTKAALWVLVKTGEPGVYRPFGTGGAL